MTEIDFDPLKHIHDMKECDDGIRCIHCGLTSQEILDSCCTCFTKEKEGSLK